MFQTIPIRYLLLSILLYTFYYLSLPYIVNSPLFIHQARIFPFLIITLGLLTYYLYSRLFKPYVSNFTSSYLKNVYIVISILMVGFVIVALLAMKYFPYTYVTIGLLIYMGYFLFIIVTVLCIHIIEIILSFRKSNSISTNKRNILTFSIAFILTYISLTLNIPPIIKNVDISLPNLKLPTSQSYKLIQLSDIHVSPIINSNHLKDLVDQLELLKPDCIVITGDLIDGYYEYASSQLYPLEKLQNIAKDGVYFVAGNHDYYHGDFTKWLPILKSLGINVLHNQNVQVNNLFNLAGVDDFTAHSFATNAYDHGANMGKATTGLNTDLPTILLAHQPNHIHQAANTNAIDLQLSGHTHAGQIFPFSLFNGLANSYVYGLSSHKYKNHITQIYVTSGTFWWGPPIRLFTYSEIVSINLKSEL